MKSLSICLVSACLLFALGCGSAEQGSAESVAVVEPLQIEWTNDDPDSPLSHQDVENFIRIVEHLPGRKIPDFALTEFDSTVPESDGLPAHVLNLRRSYHKAIDPQHLSQKWLEHRQTALIFEENGIDAEKFAALSTKVSLAWSAAAIRGEIPVLVTQRKLREQLATLAQEYQHLDDSISEHDRQEKLNAINESIALNEFLEFIKTVPNEGVEVVRANSEKLKKYLPEADIAERFERRFESSPEVVRVGHAQQAQ